MKRGILMEEMRDYLIETPIAIEEFRTRYPNLSFLPISSRLIILTVPPGAEEEFSQIEQEVGSIFLPILLGLNAIDAVEESNISTFHDYPFGELRGNGIIIGFIDTGIDYTNPIFKFEDNTTRVVNIWDQSIEGTGGSLYPYGTIYTEEQINEALRSSDPFSIVPSRDENGHGTMLAGIAAGNERGVLGGYVGGAPDASIAIVKLKPAKAYLKEAYLIKEGAVAYQENDYLTGINYLLQLAVELGKPIAICTAIGSNQGGHDGTTIVERYLQEASVFENVIFALSAGNEANQGHHYNGRVTQGGSSLFEINVGENERGFSMDLWVTSPDKLAVSVRTPLGGDTGRVPINDIRVQTYTFPLENAKIQIEYVGLEINSGEQSIRFRFITPTPGIWAVVVYGENVVDGSYNVWLPREGFVERETVFLQPNVNMTITTPANAYESLVVGAYNGTDQSIFAGSSRGPTRNMVNLPSLVAPGVNVLAPNLTGGYSRYSGTGVATAVTISACALLLEWAILEGNLRFINTLVAKTILIRGARRNPNQPYPNNIEGYGKLDFQNSLALI